MNIKNLAISIMLFALSPDAYAGKTAEPIVPKVSEGSWLYLRNVVITTGVVTVVVAGGYCLYKLLTKKQVLVTSHNSLVQTTDAAIDSADQPAGATHEHVDNRFTPQNNQLSPAERVQRLANAHRRSQGLAPLAAVLTSSNQLT